MVKPSVENWKQVADDREGKGPLDTELMSGYRVYVNSDGLLMCGVPFHMEKIEKGHFTMEESSQNLPPAQELSQPSIDDAGNNLLRAAGGIVPPRETTFSADSFFSELSDEPPSSLAPTIPPAPTPSPAPTPRYLYLFWLVCKIIQKQTLFFAAKGE